MAAQSKAKVCGCSLAGIVGSNPARGMKVYLLWVLCVIRSLHWADHSSRGVVLNVMCLSVMVKPRQWGDPGPQGAVTSQKENSNFACCVTWMWTFVCDIEEECIKYIYLLDCSRHVRTVIICITLVAGKLWMLEHSPVITACAVSGFTIVSASQTTPIWLHIFRCVGKSAKSNR